MGSKPFRSRLEKAQRELSSTFGEEHLVGFRNDVEDIWAENRSGKSYDVNNAQVAMEVRSSLQQSRNRILTVEDGMNKLQLLDGLTGGATAGAIYMVLRYFGVTNVPSVGIAVLVFLFFTMFNHGVIFTKALINTVCYPRASPAEDPSRLLFKRGWNAGVLNSNSSIIGILLVALARRFWSDGYDLGLVFIKKWDGKKS